MPAKTYVFDLAEVRQGTAGPGAALLMDELFVQWSWPGGAPDAHGPAADRLSYVLDGEVVWDVAGTEYRLGAGDALYLPAGITAKQTGADGTVVDVLGRTAWDKVHLAEHQLRNEYRDWVRDNPAAGA